MMKTGCAHCLYTIQWQHAENRNTVFILLFLNFQCALTALTLACAWCRLLSPSGTYFESFLSKQKCSLDLLSTRGDARGTVSCILHCQRSIIPVSLVEVGQMVQWLQQELCLAVICCHQQIPFNTKSKWPVLTIISEIIENDFSVSHRPQAKMSSSQTGFTMSTTICVGRSIAMPCVEQRAHWHFNHGQNERSGSRCQGGVHTERRLMRQGGMVRIEEPLPLGCSTAWQPWAFDLWVNELSSPVFILWGERAASNGTVGDWRAEASSHLDGQMR